MTSRNADSRTALSVFLSRVARRVRWIRGIRRASPCVLVACLLLLVAAIASAFGAFAVSSPLYWLSGLVLLASLVVLVTALSPWRAPDLLRAATTTDQRAGLNDLMRSAVEIGSRPEGQSRREEEERPFRELLAARASQQARELDVDQVAPVVVPRHLIVSVASVLIALALPTADTERRLFSLQSSDLITRDVATEPLSDETEASETDPPIELERMELEEENAPTRLAQLLDVELELSALSDEPGEGSAGETSDRELTDAELAALEEALAENQQMGEGPADMPASTEAQSDGLKELAREGGDEAPTDGTDPEHAGGESAQSGEGQAQVGEQASDANQQGPVKEIEMPPPPGSKMQRANDAAQADARLNASAQNGQQMPRAQAERQSSEASAGGEAGGPQGDQVAPLGQQPKESEVTLELAVLVSDMEEKEKREKTRKFKESRQQGAKLSLISVEPAEWPEVPDVERRRSFERQHQSTIHDYFVPSPRESDGSTSSSPQADQSAATSQSEESANRGGSDD